MYSPIIIFAFNRPESFEATVESLKHNPESSDSDLFIFIDGARSKDGEIELVNQVKAIANNVNGFKSVTVYSSPVNRGLGPSIISGVTDIINRFGKVIVIEDDLIVQPNFLAYMNQGLSRYENNKEVFSICGYSNKIKVPKDYAYDAYFCVRSSSWGWATWRDRWETVDWDLDDWPSVESNRRAFNKWGGSDCFGMLKGWKEGRNKSWAIRFCYAQFIQNKVSLFPVRSMLSNNGFDGTGTNCKKWSRFKFDLTDLEKRNFRFTDNTDINSSLLRQFLSYNGILIRIWSKIMYILNR